MIHFGLKKLEIKYKKDAVEYFHFTVFIGIGNQYGMGECILSKERMNYFLSLESFLSTQFSKYVYNGPERFWHFLHHLIPNDSDIIRAIDMASRDLACKINGSKLLNLFTYQEMGNETPFLTIENPCVALLESNTLSKLEQMNDVRYCIITDKHLNETTTIHQFALKYPAINFYVRNYANLTELPNVLQYTYFEETQGLSDIYIHYSEKNQKPDLIYSTMGSIITLRMLSSLIAEDGVLLMNSLFTDVASLF